jgi:hypothetical protein
VLGGWTDIRRALLTDCAVTTLQARNKGGWLFEDVHNSIMVCLMTRHCTPGNDQYKGVRIWPSVTSETLVKAASDGNALGLTANEVASLTESWVIPWFSSPDDRPVFDRLRGFPRLGGGDGWTSGTADSSRWDFSGSGPHKLFATSVDPGKGWRVLMARHVEPYRITRGGPFQRFIPDPKKLVPLNLGVTLEGGEPVISPNHPVIVFRYPSRNDDTRTLIATALDGRGFLYSKGYVHGLRTGDASVRRRQELT